MTLPLLTSILLLLIIAFVLGELFERYGLPSVVGEILAGLILGPAVLNLVQPGATFSAIAEISLFFIILYIGIEATTDTFRANFGKSLSFSATSFFIPVIIMILVSHYVLDLSYFQSIIVSIAIGVPSISIISVLIKDNGLLHMHTGDVILASVIITDVVALAITSISIDLKQIYIEVPGIIIFVILLALLDRALRKHSEFVVSFFDRIHAMQRGEKIVFGAVIVGGLLVSLIFEEIGVTYVLGAFFAGILISDVVIGEDLNGKIKRTLTRLDDSFFIPLYFSIAGLDVIFPTGEYIIYLVVLVAISAGVGGLLNYFLSTGTVKEVKPKTVTGILGSRGAVGIIVASLALYDVGSTSLSRSIDIHLYSVALFGIMILSLVFASMVRKTDVTGHNSEKTEISDEV